MTPYFSLIVLLLLASVLVVAESDAVVHPTVNLTPEDVLRAKARITADTESQRWFANLKKSCDTWKDKDEAWVRSVMPGEGACFAYGFTGCPICNASWGTWGAVRTSFETPGKVKCANGHLLPDDAHPDPGTGYVAPDGRIHFFLGSYNAWVVETLLFQIALPYSNLYILGDDQRAGRMAAVILDEFARIYPSCSKGSWDYPSNPPSGRFNRPWYQVARVLVYYVDVYDRIYSHPALDEPSSVPGMTRRENIEKNLLRNGAQYCYDETLKQGGLHNGQADYLRGALAVGVALDIPEWISWSVDGPYGMKSMLANNIDRDGNYFETSVGYGNHTRNLYLTFSEPLVNYRGSLYPGGLNLYDYPRFQSFMTLPQVAGLCLGLNGTYGDNSPIQSRNPYPYRASCALDVECARRLAERISDAEKRRDYSILLSDLYSIDPASRRGVSEWQLLHESKAPKKSEALPERFNRLLDGSHFYGQKGLSIMRKGEGEGAYGAILRFGPSLVHGHADDLNVNYFTQGYEITYDLGYSLGSTHTQVGWAHQTASHNVVIVDEKNQNLGSAGGGSLLMFADSPGLVVTEATSNNYAPIGVSVYRRLFAMTDRYALDVFRVRGGSKHDLPQHSLSSDVTFQGIVFGEKQPGSLAGKEYEWGNLQLNDGDMKGYPNKPYWNPPPGNGYGFLVSPQFAKPEGNWSATWQLSDASQTQFSWLALHSSGETIISATAPGLYPAFKKPRYVIRRREGKDLSSCFSTVWQASTTDAPAPVRSISRIGGDSEALSAESSFGVSVELSDGSRDVWLLSPSPNGKISLSDNGKKIRFRGVLGRARLEGEQLLEAEMLHAREMSIEGWRFSMDSVERSAGVASLPDGSPSIRIDSQWPEDGRYNTTPLYVTNKDYSRNSPYRIREVSGSQLLLEQDSTLLGRGVVAEVLDATTILTMVPHEYARKSEPNSPFGFFRGKILETENGSASAKIKGIQFDLSKMKIYVDSTKGFSKGDTFVYHDVQKGDSVSVQHSLSLRRMDDGTYSLRTNTDVFLQMPQKAKFEYLDRNGQFKLAKGGKIPRAALSESGETTVRMVKS